MAPTWTPPTALTSIPTLVQFLQCSLLFVPPSPSDVIGFKIQHHHLALFRAALLPLALYTTWTCYSHPEHSFFRPYREFMNVNLVLQVGKYLGCMRNIELALCDEREYEWMGYNWAYAQRGNAKSHAEAPTASAPVELEQETRPKLEPSGVQYGHTITEILWLGWRCNFALRGIGWSWGIKGRQIPPQHPRGRLFIPALLFRLAWAHVATVSLYAFLQYSRELSSDTSYVLFHLLGLNACKNDATLLSAGLALISRLMHVFAFGVAIYTSVEIDVCYATLVAYLLTNFFRAIIPPSSALASWIRPDPFRYEAWPRPFDKPLLSESLTELWGKRWHSLFRRTFVAVGSRPAMSIVGNMGIQSKAVRYGIGALGAFLISGIVHESVNDASPWLPHDRALRNTCFFLLQAIALVVENAFTTYTGRKVGGIYGRIWAWSFVLITGLPLTECWLERGLVDGTPSLAEREWWGWAIPIALVIPSFSRHTQFQQTKHISAL